MNILVRDVAGRLFAYEDVPAQSEGRIPTGYPSSQNIPFCAALHRGAMRSVQRASRRDSQIAARRGSASESLSGKGCLLFRQTLKAWAKRLVTGNREERGSRAGRGRLSHATQRLCKRSGRRRPLRVPDRRGTGVTTDEPRTHHSYRSASMGSILAARLAG